MSSSCHERLRSRHFTSRDSCHGFAIFVPLMTIYKFGGMIKDFPVGVDCRASAVCAWTSRNGSSPRTPRHGTRVMTSSHRPSAKKLRPRGKRQRIPSSEYK